MERTDCSPCLLWSFDPETRVSSSQNHFSWDPAASQIYAPSAIASQSANFDHSFSRSHHSFSGNLCGVSPAAGTGISSQHISYTQSLESSINQLSLSGTRAFSFSPSCIVEEQVRNSVLQREISSASDRVFPLPVVRDMSCSTSNMHNDGQSLLGASSVSSASLYQSVEQFHLNRISQYLSISSNDLGANGNLGMNAYSSSFSGRTLNRVRSPELFSPLRFTDRVLELQFHPEQLSGNVALWAKDQSASKKLHYVLHNATAHLEQVEIIFREIKDQLSHLSMHNFANYTVQKLISVCNEDKISQLLLTFFGSKEGFQNICIDAYGTRPVQELVKKISTREQRSLILSVLRPFVLEFTFNSNAYRVIEQCILNFPGEETKDIVNALVDCFFEVATNRKGCRVLQSCLSHAEPQAKQRLLAGTAINALLLSEHEFGNYVVQYAITKLEEPQYAHVLGDIAATLQGNFVTLSMNKYASNVVEKLLECSSIRGATEITSRIINEIMNHPNFLRVLLDDYGNFVAQKALLFSEGGLHRALVSCIQHYQPQLQGHPFGGKVLGKLKGHRR